MPLSPQEFSEKIKQKEGILPWEDLLTWDQKDMAAFAFGVGELMTGKYYKDIAKNPQSGAIISNIQQALPSFLPQSALYALTNNDLDTVEEILLNKKDLPLSFQNFSQAFRVCLSNPSSYKITEEQYDYLLSSTFDQHITFLKEKSFLHHMGLALIENDVPFLVKILNHPLLDNKDQDGLFHSALIATIKTSPNFWEQRLADNPEFLKLFADFVKRNSHEFGLIQKMRDPRWKGTSDMVFAIHLREELPKDKPSFSKKM